MIAQWNFSISVDLSPLWLILLNYQVNSLASWWKERQLDKITIQSDSFGQDSKLLLQTTLHAPRQCDNWHCMGPLPVFVFNTNRLWPMISKVVPINYRVEDRNQTQGVQRESSCWQSRGERGWPPHAASVYRLKVENQRRELCSTHTLVPCCPYDWVAFPVSQTLMHMQTQSLCLHTVTFQAASPIDDQTDSGPAQLGC